MRCVLTIIILVVTACSDNSSHKQRVIVLGFDGMDYALTKELMKKGRLPNLSQVAKNGTFIPLETAVPPQSPVAWSNFITGLDSGGHGIFDFIHRDPQSMAPFLSTSKTNDTRMEFEIGRYKFPLLGGDVELLRRGRAFWEILTDYGIKSTIIRMPANFPPSKTATRELSGMGTPDLMGGYGTFSFYTSKLFAFAGEDIGGGSIYEVNVIDGIVKSSLYGPDNPFLTKSSKIESAFTVYIDPVDPVIKLVVGTEERILREGEWTDWVPVQFKLIPTQSMTAIARFYLRSVRPDFELYVSPLNFDPLAPVLPISKPDFYAAELAEATGRFYTQGMPEDTSAMNAGVLTTDEFLEQAEIAGKEISDQYRYVLNQFNSGLLFYYFGNLDQVSHMMWHTRDPEHPQHVLEEDELYGDLIAKLYEDLDQIVRYTLEEIDDDTTLLIMSDHGFTSFRRAFHMNKWLEVNGYLKVKNNNLKNDPGGFSNIDWSGTYAYNVGLNALYINLKNREKNGIVPPRDRSALMDEISQKLLAFIDPDSGKFAITKVYQREQVYKDRGSLEIGPDLVIGYAKGTRGSGHSALGAVGMEVITDNVDEWSGDHEMDHEVVPGVLFTNRRLKKPATRLQDLAAAILAEFGILAETD